MQSVAIYMTVFSYIAMTKGPIDYKSFINYKSLIIRKVAIKIIIGLNTKVFAVKIVIIESLISGAVKVDRDDMHAEMTFIK